MALTINHLSKSFGEHIVLKDFSANIPIGQVTLLTAPSGKGKTTLLRILMGLETADSGEFSDFSGLKQSAVFQEAHCPTLNWHLLNCKTKQLQRH